MYNEAQFYNIIKNVTTKITIYNYKFLDNDTSALSIHFKSTK